MILEDSPTKISIVDLMGMLFDEINFDSTGQFLYQSAHLNHGKGEKLTYAQDANAKGDHFSKRSIYAFQVLN